MAPSRKNSMLILSLFLATALGGCVIDIADVCLDDEWAHGAVEVSASFFRSVSASGLNSLNLVGGAGTVTIQGQPGQSQPGQSEILIHAQRRVRADTRREAEEALRNLRVMVGFQGPTLQIETRHPDPPRGRTYLVDYEITVPEHFQLSLVNGSGNLGVVNLQGNLTIESGNGDIILEDFRGSSWVSLGNGEIDGKLILPLQGHLVHTVGNGGIRLQVQQEVSAEFSAQVGNGTIDLSGLEFSIWASGPGFAQGTLGTGQGSITLSVGNGWVRVEGQ